MYPLVVKHLLLPVHELLLGRRTFSYLRTLENTQWWSTDRLRELQEQKLHQLSKHASTSCPFYRRRMKQVGLDPKNMTLDTLRHLATLTKTDIRGHAAEMTARTIKGGLYPYTTGGSTGDPLVFQIDRARQAADQAARARSRRWFGVDIGQRELYLWGAPVELAGQDRMKQFRDRLTNHKLLSAFNMTRARMSSYFDEIRRFDPVHIFGYPSSLAGLVRHGLACGQSLQTPSLKAVFTTGEVFLPSDRAVIEESVSATVADGYGSREGGFIAHQCPHGSYHVTMESLIVELLNADGEPVARDRPGEVTVTHLDAYGMPFIRYRTGDVARRGRTPCPCGRGLETLDIVEGRKTDMLRTTEGGFAHALSVIYVLREEPAIRQFKVEQAPNLDLDVTVVAESAFDVQRQQRLCGLLRKQIGETIDVRIHSVREIEPDPSGKHRYVVAANRDL